MINSLEISNLHSLMDVVNAYEEIASIRMRRVKRSVLEMRVYLEGVHAIFEQVKSSYKSDIPKNYNTIRETNGKTAAILLSSNSGLYGAIVSETFDLFTSYLKIHSDVVPVIIGKVGKRLYSSFINNEDFKYFTLPDSGLHEMDIRKIFDEIVKYEEIVVFHGKFKDVLSQVPTMISITGDDLKSGMPKKNTDRYIFEPDLLNILSYFEKQIVATLFEQTVYESNLSKYASRMVGLDAARYNIDKLLLDIEKNYQKYRHNKNNRKQLSKMLAYKFIKGSNGNK